jgi:N-acetylmuramoyl-L-alanine amidase
MIFGCAQPGRPALGNCRNGAALKFAASRRIYLLLLTFFCLASCFGIGSVSHAGEPPLSALSAEIAGDEMRVRAIVKFDRKPQLSRLIISNPYRLVIDLPETAFAFKDNPPAVRGLVSDMRFGLMQEGKSRIVITSKGPFALDLFEVRKSGDTDGYQLVLDLSASTNTAFEALLDREAERTGATAATSKGDRIGQAAVNVNRPFTVVLDAGHGGIDTGARGISGTLEKDVTLGFVHELNALLSTNPKLRVVLTRDSDIFLPLAERVRIARQNEADIFIAVHADTISLHGLRGATVYTISEKASDEVAQAVARNENLSDAIAGMTVESQDSEVSDILIDLMRRETQKFSVNLASAVVGKFQGNIRLINNPHRSAGFLVLRAPDVPSILVELGYLSNPQDEKLLNDVQWRDKTANLLVGAIETYAASHRRPVNGNK